MFVEFVLGLTIAAVAFWAGFRLGVNEGLWRAEVTFARDRNMETIARNQIKRMVDSAPMPGNVNRIERDPQPFNEARADREGFF